MEPYLSKNTIMLPAARGESYGSISMLDLLPGRDMMAQHLRSLSLSLDYREYEGALSLIHI